LEGTVIFFFGGSSAQIRVFHKVEEKQLNNYHRKTTNCQKNPITPFQKMAKTQTIMKRNFAPLWTGDHL